MISGLDTHKFFFFQAEDGIRDIGVTGVQTCALPILGKGSKGDKKQTGPPQMQTLLPSQGNHRLNAKTAQQLAVDVSKAHIGQGVRSPKIQSTDRKSTRLNSSHANISYAVFCLKKKK